MFYKRKRNVSASKIIFFVLVVVMVFTISILVNYSKDEGVQEVKLNLTEVADKTASDFPEPPKPNSELLASEIDNIHKKPPIAEFEVTTPVKVGEKIEYKDLSYDRNLGGNVVNRRWEGKKDYFVKPGAYTITLSVQNDQGDWSDPVSHVVHVIENKKENNYNIPPIALFKVTSPIYVGESVIYENNSFDPDGNEIAEVEWENKENYFTKPGEYRVSLRVRDSLGKWSDPAYQYVVVEEKSVIEAQNRPVAIFNAPSTVYVGQEINYIDKSFDPDGDKIIKRDWSDNKKNKYNKVGEHTITLRVQDEHNEWSELYKKEIRVISEPNTPPIAMFNTQPTVRVNEPVDWEDTSYDSDGVITNRQWSGNKQYMYTEEGEYDVTLIVWDDKGAQGSITKQIKVVDDDKEAPIAKFHTNSPVLTGEKVYYWDDSYSNHSKIAKVEWGGHKKDFYDNPGIYEVTLKVWDEYGNYSSTKEEVVVAEKNNSKPIVKIEGPQQVEVNETAIFRDVSYDPDGFIASNSWGDDKLIKTWDTPGIYEIDLEVTDNTGNSSDVTIQIYVGEDFFPHGPEDR